MNEVMRLFVALTIPDDIAEKIQDVTRRIDKFPTVKTVSKTNLHLNLEFLGERKPQPVIDSLQNIDFDTFTLKTSTYGFFPDKDHIRVVWLGVEENKMLTKLQENVSTLTDDDKQYVPHITIARIKDITEDQKQKLLQTLNNNVIQPSTFTVESFKLYESTTTDIGPIYNVIHSFSS